VSTSARMGFFGTTVGMLQRTLPARGSSRRASQPKPISCRQAANGCTKSSTMVFGSLRARRAYR
jgi:hypothetical protein